MSSGDKDLIPIERGIQRRKRGTYRVRVVYHYEQYQCSFRTLKEARKFRDMVRKGRVPVKGSTFHQAYHPMDSVAAAREKKREIAQARKKAQTILRDGREYKLVKL